MDTALVPEDAFEPIHNYMNKYLRGLGRRHLLKGRRDGRRLHTGAAMTEAFLDLEGMGHYFTATPLTFDHFFRRFVVLLLEEEKVVGTLSVQRIDSLWKPGPISLGGMEGLVAAVEEAESFQGSSTAEARLVTVTQIYLRALVLVRDAEPLRYFIISPRYRSRSTSLDPSQFEDVAVGLARHHLQVLAERPPP